MKLEYESEDIRQQAKQISKSFPKLYEPYTLVLTKLKSFDYEDLKLFIEEELARSKNSKNRLSIFRMKKRMSIESLPIVRMEY